eukprot:scaffold100349_cov18-Tisochrysis_lutea.AAC.2
MQGLEDLVRQQQSQLRDNADIIFNIQTRLKVRPVATTNRIQAAWPCLSFQGRTDLHERPMAQRLLHMMCPEVFFLAYNYAGDRASTLVCRTSCNKYSPRIGIPAPSESPEGQNSSYIGNETDGGPSLSAALDADSDRYSRLDI